MENKVIMLTKEGCPSCATAKIVLEKVLQNKYNNNIEFVKKEDNLLEYQKLVTEYSIMAMPAFIFKDKVLRDVNPMSLSSFLKTNLG